MTEDEFPFKVGDTVWFVRFGDAESCTLTSFNKLVLMPDVATITVEMKDGRRLCCLPKTLHVEPPERKAKPTTRVGFEYCGERQVYAQNLKLPPEPIPEPLCSPSEASIENLAAAIDHWAASVRGFSHGFDCSEEYQHDLMDREEVHGILNGLQQSGVSIPAALQTRLDEDDQWFMALTKDDQGVWGDSERYDQKFFWYYFRWLK